MAIMSTTTIGIFLFTLPFCIIALHSFTKYLADKRNSKNKYIFYVFLCFSIAFILNTIGSSLVLPDMSQNRLMAVTTFFKLFDVVNMLGVFWLFVFLTDFVDALKEYIPLAAVHLLITLILILVMPYGINMMNGGEYVKDRDAISSLAILVFWFIYWGVIAYQFWKNSKLITNKIAIRRSQMMSLGGIFAILAYICAILSNVVSGMILVYLSIVCTVTAGIVFYAGFVAPNWMRRRWEK